MTKRTPVTWFLTLCTLAPWFRLCLSQSDCTGVHCPPLENCIEEVLETGACCATCTQRGCPCEGYQYYDCIRAKFRNGKVPEGEFYLVDFESTNCTCPVGGGRIICRFIQCEAVPPNCIDLAEPPDACPHCLRIGCVYRGQRFEAGHSFQMDPCQVCHCPNNGGKLMCSPIPDCTPETLQKHTPPKEFHPSHRPSDDRRYVYVAQTTENPVVVPPSLGFPKPTTDTHSAPHRPPQEVKGSLPEEKGIYNPNEDATRTRTFQQNQDGSATRTESVYREGVRPSRLPSDDTPEGHKREPGTSSGQRKHQYRIPDHSILNNRLQSNPTTSPPVNLRELETYGQNHLLESFRKGRSHQFSRTDRSKVSSSLIERCCAAGEKWVSDHDHCGNMVPIRGEGPDSACWSVQKQCCMTWWRDQRCSAGLEAAKQGRGCEPDAAELCDPYQECCRCCEVGLRLHAEEEDWEIPRGLGEPCSHIILSCYEAATQNNLSTIWEMTEPQGTSRPTKVVPDPDRQSFSLGKVEDTENMVLEVEDVDECEVYKDLLCHHECVNIPGSYVCTCFTGHVLHQDGMNCLPVQLAEENQVKEESQGIEKLHPAETTPTTPPAPPDPCEGNGPCAQHCTPVAGRPQCSCFPGFSLMSDGRSCEDTDECALSTHTCPVSERCINTLGHFSCERPVVCPSGYHLRNHVCEDLNECIMGTHNCGLGFDCINTAGSFSCRARTRCPGGFTLDPQGQCVDIDECRTVNQPCSPGFNCINTHGSYSCQRSIIMCGRGYHASADGSRCADINECETGVHRCVEDQLCHNLPGTYRCDCRPGYQYDVVRRMCVDVNECWRYRLCAQTCENTPGSYRCSCTPGFALSSDGKNCEDVNECLSSPCSQECTNVYGSFQCHCRPGYYLDEDGVTCKDYDECSQSVGNLCAYKCVNVPGSYTCVCPEHGYTIAPNRRSCQDVDECGTSTHNCTADQTCYNIQGGFRCLSFSCPTNYRRSSDARCERIACPNFLLCQNTPARITYYYLTFQVNIIVPALIFRMGPSPAYAGDNIIISITGGNEDNYFSPRKISAYTGAIYLQRQIPQPHDFLLDVEMKLLRQATLTTFQARIYVFVTAYLG